MSLAPVSAAAFARGQVLRRVEAERREVRARSDAHALVRSGDRVRGVLDDVDPAIARHREQRIEIGRMARVMNRHDRARPRRQRRLDAFRIDVERVGADVDHHRPRADVLDDVRGRAEGHRRHDHLVAGTDAERRQRDVQAGRARVQRHQRRRAEILLQLALEAPRLWTLRDPIAAQRIEDLFTLGVTERGRRKRKKGAPHNGLTPPVAGYPGAAPPDDSSRPEGRSINRVRSQVA